MFGCWVYSFSKSTQLPVVTDQEWGLHHERVCKVWAGCRMQDASAVYFHTSMLTAKDDHRGQQRKRRWWS